VAYQRVPWAGLCLLVAASRLPLASAEFDVTPTRIELIPPGTVIGQRAPEPWTHLIVKSQPRVTDGDVDEVSRNQIRLAETFSMSTVARVERIDQGGVVSYRLARLASGLGVHSARGDVIVSPDTADVGFLAGILLDEMYEQQKSVEIILRSATTAIYDTPIAIRINNKNRMLVLRYAVLVDEHTGQLDTLAWLIDVDAAGRYLGLSGHLQWLKPNLSFDCRLYVDKSEYSWGIPSDVAYACLKPTPGRLQLSVKKGPLTTLIAKERWTLAEAPTVDAGLRDVLKQARAADQTAAK
jgi:hypothetical protein